LRTGGRGSWRRDHRQQSHGVAASVRQGASGTIGRRRPIDVGDEGSGSAFLVFEV
jgi:hypothetical protein